MVTLLLWSMAIVGSLLVVGILLSLSTALRRPSPKAKIRERDSVGRRTNTSLPIAGLPIGARDQQLLADCALMSADVYEPSCKSKLRNKGRAWDLDVDIPKPTASGYAQTPQLTYRLWLDHGGQTACITFRGSYLLMDWYSNFRWITCLIPFVEDHYEQTERITPAIVDYIIARWPTYRIVAAGHSLGGGLAQTAAYSACGAIDTAFAFDSSPVTKHRAGQHCKSKPQKFYRLYEQSEVLSYIRLWLRLALGLTACNPHIMEIRVHLLRGRLALRRHSMKHLAPELQKRFP
jgi:pimeloyl-ACP methyl ester carboxylesterase